mgnify:FL=1
MNKKTFEGLWKNGLVALVVICLLSVSMSACTPVDLQHTVSTSVSVLEAPGVGQWVIYGADPLGREWVATVTRFGKDIQLSAGLADVKTTVKMTEDLVRMGWNVIDWSKLPNAVQLLILSRVENAIPLVEQVSARSLPMISIFGLPGAFYSEFVKEDCQYTDTGYICDL